MLRLELLRVKADWDLRGGPDAPAVLVGMLREMKQGHRLEG